MRLESLERHEQVFKLRIAGHSFAEIARRLDYADESGPHYVITRELKRRLGEPSEELRQLQIARHEAIWVELFERFTKQCEAKDGEISLELVDRLLKTLAGIGRLCGLESAKVQLNLGEDKAEQPRSTAEQVKDLLDKLRSRAADQAKPLDVIDHANNGTH